MILTDSFAAPRIRQFQQTDGALLRSLACQTANIGWPFENGFDAFDFLADLLIGFYVEEASDWIWVAEVDNELAGYVCVAPDEKKFRKFMIMRTLPALVMQIFFGREFRRPPNRRFLARQARDWLLHGRATPIDMLRFPAHLHVNMASAFRGKGLGRALLQTALAALWRAGIAGVRASVRDDNSKAIAFFRSIAFKPLGTAWAVSPAPGMNRRAILLGLCLGDWSCERKDGNA